jgi:hypothetical protein
MPGTVYNAHLPLRLGWPNTLCTPALVMQPDSASASPLCPPPHQPQGCCTHVAVEVDRLHTLLQ